MSRRTLTEFRGIAARAARRRYVAALAGVLLAACAHAPPHSPAAPQVVRVATFNIFAGNDLERRPSVDRVAALIDSLEIDIVLLQEVDRRTTRSGNVDQPALLAARSGRHVVFGRSMDFDDGEFGNAILSRWPVTARQVRIYDDSTDEGRAREPRSLLHVIVQTPAGPLHLLNTHLDHGGNGARRALQVRQLRRYVDREVPSAAALIAGGDMNAVPQDSTLVGLVTTLRDAWTACGRGDGVTFRADAPDRRIDYIFLRGVTCTDARVHPTTLSDHRPVIVDVSFE